MAIAQLATSSAGAPVCRTRHTTAPMPPSISATTPARNQPGSGSVV